MTGTRASWARILGFALVVLLAAAGPRAALAAAKPGAAQPILPGGDAKDPVSIDADKLVYFDKEQKAVYSGNVVVIQGDTKLTCSTMTVFSTSRKARRATLGRGRRDRRRALGIRRISRRSDR